MTNKELRQKMEELVSKYHKRKESKAEFCKLHGISTAKLGYWTKELKETKVGPKKTKKEKGQFVSIKKEVVPQNGSSMRVVFPNGIEIHVTQLENELLTNLLNYVGK